MTSRLICPQCGEKNDLTDDNCQACGALLKPIDSPDQEDHNLTEGIQKADHDLPELLHSLKQDAEDQEPDEEQPSGSEQPGFIDDGSHLDGQDDDEQVPDWLSRIRQRAEEEVDSIGEITQKINVARESLEKDKLSRQQDEFDSLLGQIRGQPEEDDQNQDDRSTPPLEEEELDWLAKIRQAQGLVPEDTQHGSGDAENRAGDSLLQWLEELEGDQSGQDVTRSKVSETARQDGDGDTREIKLSQPSSKNDVTQQVAVPRDEKLNTQSQPLSITREEQAKADQLSATVMDERRARPEKDQPRTVSSWILRLVIAVILIALLSLMLFVFGGNRLPAWLLRNPTQAMVSWADNLPQNSSLLLVFDYQAGFAGEISLVVEPVLESVLKQNTNVSVVSSSAAGPLLASQILKDTAGMDPGDWVDLGYYPVRAYGAFAIANQSAPTWRFIDLPETGKSIPLSVFDGVLIFSDSYEGAIAWIEQLSSLNPEVPVYLLVTAQAGPMLQPYIESGQVAGMISGFADAAAHETLHKNSSQAASRWGAFQAGVIMMILLMIIGAVFTSPGPNMEDEAGSDDAG